MLPAQRDAVILALLQQQRVVTVEAVCAQCNCSAVTARRDLERLAREGLLRRTHGGAVSVSGSNGATPATDTRTLLEARAALADRSNVLVVTPTESALIRQIVERARRSLRAGDRRVRRLSGRHHHDCHRRLPGRARAGPLRGPLRAGATARAAPAARRQPFAREHRVAQPRIHAGPARDVRLRLRSSSASTGTVCARLCARWSTAVLNVHPEINMIMGINDDSVLGALDAYRSAGLRRAPRRPLRVRSGRAGHSGPVGAGRAAEGRRRDVPRGGRPGLRGCGRLRLPQLRPARADHYAVRGGNRRDARTLLLGRRARRNMGHQLEQRREPALPPVPDTRC